MRCTFKLAGGKTLVMQPAETGELRLDFHVLGMHMGSMVVTEGEFGAMVAAGEQCFKRPASQRDGDQVGRAAA